MHVVTEENTDRRSEGRDLGERKVDEDHASLDDVDAQVGQHSSQDQAGDERGEEDLEDAHGRAPFIAASVSASSFTS